jgi:hypothetical protein
MARTPLYSTAFREMTRPRLQADGSLRLGIARFIAKPLVSPTDEFFLFAFFSSRASSRRFGTMLANRATQRDRGVRLLEPNLIALLTGPLGQGLTDMLRFHCRRRCC